MIDITLYKTGVNTYKFTYLGVEYNVNSKTDEDASSIVVATVRKATQAEVNCVIETMS